MTPAREAYEQGYSDTVTRLTGILAYDFKPNRDIPFDGGKVMYLRGVVAKLQKTLDDAKGDLMAAERKLDELVAIDERGDEMLKTYMFTGEDIRHFKMIVYASSEKRAKDYIRRESIGSTAHRTLKFRGEGRPVDPSGLEWVAANAG